MHRRAAVRSLALSTAALATPHWAFPSSGLGRTDHPPRRGTFSMDGNTIRFSHPGITQPCNLLMLADTHLFRDDERGEAYTAYSKRMAKAYNQTIHYRTGTTINPEIAFVETLQIAREKDNALLAMIGDIFSFPSEAAIEWALEKLNSIDLPFVYTAGNHDWHYEGMDGSSAFLRDTWIRNRLTPLYSGRDPMMQKIEMNGVNLIIIDNSTYEISETQLAYLNNCLSEQKPAVLMLHIPLYAPGRQLAFGCGHPQWCAQNDKNFQLERRLPWRASGHTQTTMQFHETVFNSPNLLGILAGHIHDQSIDIINGIPQVVTESNAEGGYLQVIFTPS